MNRLGSVEMNRIYQGDCAEGMRALPDSSIDMTITSPPYDNLRTYNGYTFEFENVAKELYRVTKRGGVIVWVVSDATLKGSETGTSFKQALYFKQLGFNLHDTMVWYKESCRFPDTVRYYDSFEYMFVLSKGKPKTINLIADKPNKWAGTKMHGTDRQPDGTTMPKKGCNKRNVKDFGVRYNVWTVYNTGKRNNPHPAMFPEKLAEDHILSWSNPGDIVLDPFMGSGTTAKMAILNNRNFIGFEVSGEYVQIANTRIQSINDKEAMPWRGPAPSG